MTAMQPEWHGTEVLCKISDQFTRTTHFWQKQSMAHSKMASANTNKYRTGTGTHETREKHPDHLIELYLILL